ncbi:hypothetical protein PPL_06778 [Heterostelium album PN500]|uniref:Uncharacterized protein n=1 Tax=Heterostelium pallidum (strain ATCC 26659 / Pp 5 / PN500) TaxID=670386 RepID=D3BFP3_HETP5|nr:hypothetical protein PPL_06778 [Heterostelium album PN500]EFA79957.1 hypothetical protein PPL_06778 [Heterostelium album PN500]|eukprot:XP_020432077.1 hypothetical protein PPL_06778 [Heterostelium album PN500]
MSTDSNVDTSSSSLNESGNVEQATFNSQDTNSLSNLIECYDLYFRFNHRSNTTTTRIQCVSHFVEYHYAKYSHYFDPDGYTKFIAEVFFDPSQEVFDQLLLLHFEENSVLLETVFYKIISHNRFKPWFRQMNEYSVTRLKYRIGQFRYWIEKDRLKKIAIFKKKNLYDIVYNNKSICQQISKTETKTRVANDYIKVESNNNIILSKLLLEKIVSYSIVFNDFSEQRYKESSYSAFRNEHTNLSDIVDVSQILNFALVSKHFFSYVSKVVNNKHFDWNGFLNINNTSNEYSLVKSAPLYFNYESIKYIPYDKGVGYAYRLMSRVETFVIQSDEGGYSNGDQVRKSIFDQQYRDLDNIESNYRYYVVTDRYLVYPPPMPNLKEIVITKYLGFEQNYTKLLTHIMVTTPNANGNGIERFTVNIIKDSSDDPDCSYLYFLKPLFDYHSKTLKSIDISYSLLNREDYTHLYVLMGDIIPQIKENHINLTMVVEKSSEPLAAYFDDDDSPEINQFLVDTIQIINK